MTAGSVLAGAPTDEYRGWQPHSIVKFTGRSQVSASYRGAFERLEPLAFNGARAVLRRGGDVTIASLSDRLAKPIGKSDLYDKETLHEFRY